VPTIVVAVIIAGVIAAKVAARHPAVVVPIPATPSITVVSAIIIVDLEAEAAIANIYAKTIGLSRRRRRKVGGEYD
jgi:hypothetical protein